MKHSDAQAGMVRPEIEAKISALLAQMTVEEKAGQICQLGPSLVGGFNLDALIENGDPDWFKNARWDYREDWIRAGWVGSYLGVQGAETINRLQKIALEESRLGIPLLFGMDVIHGYRTIFPTPLAEACSWEPELARKNAAIAAKEAAAAGIHWTFAPMVDIARDARWGRIVEGSGEDPYLGSRLAAAHVEGFQGDDLTDPEHVLACAKHYIAYGGAAAGRDYNTVDISLQTLHEIYLPPFEAAVRAGVGTLMSSFNDLNGVPASANRYTLTDVLRGQLGFNGFVVSDSNSIGELVAHGFAEDRKDAGKKALLAGVDMDMVTETYRQDLPGLVEDGAVPMEALDEAVRRVLRLKFLLGLFERPFRSSPEKERDAFLRVEYLDAARDAARRSFVLLKNEGGILPLKKDLKKILVCGPLADNAFEMLGSWSFTGSAQDAIPFLRGIREATGSSAVVYVKGCDVEGKEADSFQEAAREAEDADAIIAVVGESAEMGGEAASRLDLGLPGRQEELLKTLKASGKPLVVALVNGRPLAIPWVKEHADAILEAWQPGVQGGPALADVLFGDYNPAGKLAVTFPYFVGQAPIYYNHPSTGRPMGEFKFTSKYIDGPTEPLFPFGFGLSYTTFEYSNLRISPAQCGPDGKVTVTFDLANTGAAAGEEVAQLYISDAVASRVRPVKELKGFTKVRLEAGEKRTLSLDLEASSLGFYDEALQYRVEAGLFRVFIGPNSQEGLGGELAVQ